MKLRHIILLICVCAGCISLNKKIVQMSSNQQVAPLVVVQPRHSVVWNPGGYSHFVVVSSSDLGAPLSRWPTYLETDTTNFQFVANEQKRFWTLYGTNAATGDYAWVK